VVSQGWERTAEPNAFSWLKCSFCLKNKKKNAYFGEDGFKIIISTVEAFSAIVVASSHMGCFPVALLLF